MRLDHLLSKEEEVGVGYTVWVSRRLDIKESSGGDALMGHTRTHPEHDG